MTSLLYITAFLTFTIGVAHSVLGERYILIRLFRRNNLPKLFGGPEFTILTLRFAWHITTIAWWGLNSGDTIFNYCDCTNGSKRHEPDVTYSLSGTTPMGRQLPNSII